MTTVSNGRNRVRIIGGKWRSRIVKFPAAAQLRPTPDRVRETVFNWLGQRLDGRSCLDLFAGSGALGFEAMSRGAQRVVMVECDRATAKGLKESALALEASGLDVVEEDALGYLKRPREKFDVVFLDPPYASELAMRALALLPQHLNPGARVYVEAAEGMAPPAPWNVLREDRAGAVRYALLELISP
ncbi:MAG: 16S rRNA (guanine(966)-N(2))-methyltransferase RsmD [Usitatibacter sp.]